MTSASIIFFGLVKYYWYYWYYVYMLIEFVIFYGGSDKSA